jgi:hypothetical protein
VLQELDEIYASDLELIDQYVHVNRRLRSVRGDLDKMEVRLELASGTEDEAGTYKMTSDLRKAELYWSTTARQTFRAIEATINERHRRLKERVKQQGGQAGVRQKGARDGVPTNKTAAASGTGITWLDEARKKSHS